MAYVAVQSRRYECDGICTPPHRLDATVAKRLKERHPFAAIVCRECFARLDEPPLAVERDVYAVEGPYYDDYRMFFVSEILDLEVHGTVRDAVVDLARQLTHLRRPRVIDIQVQLDEIHVILREERP